MTTDRAGPEANEATEIVRRAGFASGLRGSRREKASADSPGSLLAEQIRVHFEGVKAVDDVDCVLHAGEILGLIGPNGAGKTTLVNVLSGFQRPTAGRIVLGGVDVTKWPAHRLAQHGVVRTFQSLRLFNNMTVLENVEVAGVANGLTRRQAAKQGAEMLEILHLRDRAGEFASALPQGEERRLGIARAVAAGPKFVLLDEPAAGLNEAESDDLMGTIGTVRDRFGCGVLVIEHDMRVIMGLSERIQVLNYGKTISAGSPAEVRSDRAVIEAYLGTPKRQHA
jgi:ABC-type branched-subunit amino acid transport system ATPase component